MMITPIYAALLGLMLIGLSFNVIKQRTNIRAALGDGDNIEMKRCIRAQANLAEYAPIFLILLGYAEYHNLPYWALHFFGFVFLIGRLMHAYSLLKAEKYEHQTLVSRPVWRIRGMMCTLNTIGLLSIIILVQTVW
jgi:uncharacterized membrane protein YecN with MAPEG domain